MAAALRILIIAVSLALDVFAVSIGVGIRGVVARDKVRIGVAFAAAEVSMVLIGAALGAVVGRLVGGAAGYLGLGALIAVGLYMIVESYRIGDEKEPIDLARGWGLFVAALSISLDSLGIGFSILYIGVPVFLCLAAIACASVAATTLGLFFGGALGVRAELAAARTAGILLACTGLGFAAARMAGWGL